MLMAEIVDLVESMGWLKKARICPKKEGAILSMLLGQLIDVFEKTPDNVELKNIDTYSSAGAEYTERFS
jgi:hypothetical protein